MPFLIALLWFLVPAVVAADVPEAAYQRLNESLVEHHVLPRYRRLAQATADLDQAARAYCPASGGGALAALRGAYGKTLDAWMGVQHLRLGAVQLAMRDHRFQFYPDQGRVDQQLDRLLADADRAALETDAFRAASVAVQGLPALERLLWTDGRPARLVRGGFPCALAMAITANLTEMAAGLVRDWEAGGDAYSHIIAHPSPDNPYYASSQEAALDFFKALYGGLQLIQDVKLQPVLGASAAAARPRLGEAWPSRRSLANIVINLEALQALYRGEGGVGFADLARTHGQDLDLVPLLERAFQQTLATARGISAPLATAVTDPALRSQVEKLTLQVRALKQLVRTRLATNLDLVVGFNALDGD